MKYITTEKHPELKEGIEITCNDHSAAPYEYLISRGRLELHSFTPDLENGYIKEVEEKEFTKSDAKLAIDYCFNKMVNLPYAAFTICRTDNNEEWSPSDFFDKWLEVRKK